MKPSDEKLLRNTPGPWKAERGNAGDEHPLFVTAPNMDGFRPWNDADALLIAAAPDMLEVLKRLDDDFASLERSYRGSLYTTGAGYTLQPRVLELRAAIAKATEGRAAGPANETGGSDSATPEANAL